MATPAITPDPQTMPMADLKAAITQPAAPAAPVQEAPPPAPAPVEPKPYELLQNQDGSVQVKLETGEVFNGSPQQVLEQLAKSKVETTKWGRDWKQKAESVQQPQPQVQPQVQEPQVTPEQQAAREWMITEMAAALGLTPEQYIARVGMVFETSEKMAVNTAFAEFAQACPDYEDTPENAQVLAAYFPDGMDHFPTPFELQAAHAMALYQQKYKPRAQAQSAGSPPAPPPMPGSVSTATPGFNEWSMPLDQLRAAAGLK